MALVVIFALLLIGCAKEVTVTGDIFGGLWVWQKPDIKEDRILEFVEITGEDESRIIGYTPASYKEKGSYNKFASKIKEIRKAKPGAVKATIKGYLLTKENLSQSKCDPDTFDAWQHSKATCYLMKEIQVKGVTVMKFE